MACVKGLLGLVLLAVCVGRSVHGAAIDLPPESIGADTVFVIHADAEHLTPDKLRVATFLVLGDNAERATDFIAKFRERFDKLTKAGVESISVIGTSAQRVSDAENELGVDPNAPPRRTMNPPVVYFHMKAGGDPKVVEQVMTQDLPAKQKDDTRFEQEENWLVMHQKTQTPPEKTDAERAGEFADALATMPDAAVRLVMIPDARTKADMTRVSQQENAPKLAKAAFPSLGTSKWITLAISLGNNPKLMATANTSDPQAARKLHDAVNTALDDLKEQANNPGPNAGPMVFLGPIIAPLLEGLRPTTQGNNVSASLSGDPLNSIANLIATFRMNAPAPPTTAPSPAGK